MINHFIQWYVDLFTFRAGNLSLRFSYSICRGLVRDNGYEDGREDMMLLKGEIQSSATFLLGARTHFGRVTTPQQSFALLNTSWGWLRCLRVIQNSCWKCFKCNLRSIQSNRDIKWLFPTRIRDIWAWKLSSQRIFNNNNKKTRGKLALCNIRVVSSAEVVNMDVFQLGNSAVFVRARAPLQSYISSTTA